MPDQVFEVFAQALGYPAPDRLEALKISAESLPSSEIKKSFHRYLLQIEALSFGEWEELYTQTFDLNPVVAPYVGYQIWGDSYKRGNFMALLNRGMSEHGISPNGELPDHLAPVLKYLGRTSQPPPELMDVLEPSVERMQEGLRKISPKNPYVNLFEAISKAVRSMEADPQRRKIG